MQQKAWLISIIFLLGLFVLTLALVLSGRKASVPKDQFEIAVVRDIVQKTVAAGTVVPRFETDVKAHISGILEQTLVAPGERVEEGTELAKIRLVPDMMRLNEAEAAVESAQTAFANAKVELSRLDKMRAYISQTEYDTQKLQYDLRKQDLDKAKSHLQLLKTGTSSKTIHAANVVRSPVSGIVLDLPIKIGASVIEANAFNPGTTIAIVADMTDMLFVGFVDEGDVANLKQGMKLSVQIGALPDQGLDGTLEYVAPKAKSRSGIVQFEIRAAIFWDFEQKLRSGYSANAEIVLAKKTGVLAINERALEFADDKVFVWAESAPDQFEKQQVELGLSDGIFAEVVSGLKEGMRVRVP